MKYYLITLLAVLVLFVSPQKANAQFLKKLKNHVEKKVSNEAEDRTTRKADNAVDKVFDKTEGMIDKAFGKKKKKKERSSGNQSNGDGIYNDNNKGDSGASEENSAKPKGPKVVWNKFDFVPGDQVIFEDGPAADEENGEFPSRWDLLKGGAEIAEVDGQNVIMFTGTGSYIVPYLKDPDKDYLPDVFTVELDVFIPKSHSTNNRLWIYLGDQKNNRHSDAAIRSLVVMPHSLEFGDSEKYYPGTENMGWTHEKEGSWKHISIAYTKGKFKAYFNDARLINIPHLDVNPTGITIHTSNTGIFIKNFRLAKGGVKYYDRVLSDGKIIVNGIRFDVNKATLKPESMGPINKIYKLMVKNPDLKFSVEGHTDSDGDAASNLKLSKARGKTVMDKLISMGISPDRLKYNGFGESKPIDNNSTPEGKANNRRVEFVKF